MKHILRLFAILLFLAGCFVLIKLSTENSQLSTEINRLEAELGTMPIGDIDRVHIVEIANPDVPPEVASQVERVWQFRCFLPRGYDFVEYVGSGRVTQDRIYLLGGNSTRWTMPQTEPIQKLLTICLRKKRDRFRLDYSFGRSSGSSGLPELKSESKDLVVRKLASSHEGPRSFSQETILPLLRIYDPNSAQQTQIQDQKATTYAGCQIMLSPKSREQVFRQLQQGETPRDFDPSWLATEAGDE